MERSNPLISVVVPVYNVESYLPNCLDSIIGQAYPHFEVILVDDGSTDASGEICDEYERRDSRIKVIHKGNEGPSSARNAGIDIAKGEFISFVDSDDLIEPHMYQTFVRVLDDFPQCDVYSFCMTEQYPDRSINVSHGEDCFLMDDAVRLAFTKQELIWEYVCDKIWRRSTIGEVRFHLGKKNEDAIFTYQVIFSNPKIFFVCTVQCLYIYRKAREGAITYQFATQPVLDQLQGSIEVTEMVEKSFPDMSPLAYTYMLNHIKREMLGRFNSIDKRKALISPFVEAIQWLKPRLDTVGYKADFRTRVFLSYPALYCWIKGVRDIVR